MFFRKPKHNLQPIVDNIGTPYNRSSLEAPLPIYNPETQKPQSFKLTIIENNGEYTIIGSIVEKIRYRPTTGTIDDKQPSIVHSPLDIDQIHTHEVSRLFESQVVNGKITDVLQNQDPRIPESFNKTMIEYVSGNLSDYDYHDQSFRTFASSNFTTDIPQHNDMTIIKDHLKDLEEGQTFYSIRQNGQLFEVVELNENDPLFGKYDLNARQSRTVVPVYIEYETALDDLQTCIKPEHQKLDVLTTDDLDNLITEQQTL